MTLHTSAHRIFWKCDICKKVALWDDDWSTFSSIAMQEELPATEIPTVCSDVCRKVFEEKLANGRIKVRKVRLRGYDAKITGERVGY